MYGSKRKRRLHSVAVLLGPLSFGLTILLLEWWYKKVKYYFFVIIIRISYIF